jgi:7-carboxy-7-deazaguanine synthase
VKEEMINTNEDIAPLLKITYPVMEHFYTIQGEGYYTGNAAYFIRLAGCNVGCVWCDVKDSWDREKHPSYTVEQLLQEIQKTNAAIVVITGGEPLMHDCLALTKALQHYGYTTNIETSGAYALSGIWNWICVSPKKFKAPLPEVLERAHELKVVVFNKTDFDWAMLHATKVNKNCKLYLQPEWDKSSAITPLMVDFVKQHPQWQLSLQTHKYIHVP